MMTRDASNKSMTCAMAPHSVGPAGRRNDDERSSHSIPSTAVPSNNTDPIRLQTGGYSTDNMARPSFHEQKLVIERNSLLGLVGSGKKQEDSKKRIGRKLDVISMKLGFLIRK